MIKKYLGAEVKAMKDGGFEVIASSGSVDRYGDTIDPKGWYLKNYKKNPVILWSHSTGGFGSMAIPPVAKAIRVWLEDGKTLKVKGQFADTPFAQELKTLVENGFLNAVSVGFLPLVEDVKGDIEIEEKMYRRANDEETTKGIYGKGGEHFSKQELLELSWVSVPALPEALISAKEMKLDLVTKALEEKIEEEEKVDEEEGEKEEVKEEVEEEVESEEVKEPASEKEAFEERLSKVEEAISGLMEENPSGATPQDSKGRKSFIKKKSTKAKKERLLIMFDKMIETLLREYRQND